MGSMKKQVLIFSALILASILALFVFYYGDYSNPRRVIYYRYHTKISLSYVLGYMPQLYQLHYSENIIEIAKEYCLINIVYDRFPSENHNYVIFAKYGEPRSCELLLDSDLMFCRTKNRNDLISSQINMSALNDYLSYSNKEDSTEAIAFLCKLITDFGSSYYRILKETSEINDLRTVRLNGIDSTTCYKLLNDDFLPDFYKFSYIWFDEIGLFEFDFQFNQGHIKSIHDKLIFGPITISVIGTESCD